MVARCEDEKGEQSILKSNEWGTFKNKIIQKIYELLLQKKRYLCHYH